MNYPNYKNNKKKLKFLLLETISQCSFEVSRRFWFSKEQKTIKFYSIVLSIVKRQKVLIDITNLYDSTARKHVCDKNRITIE